MTVAASRGWARATLRRGLQNPSKRLALTSLITTRRNHTLDTQKPTTDDIFPSITRPVGKKEETFDSSRLVLPQKNGRSQVQVSWDQDSLSLSDETPGKSLTFQPTQLRDSCTCPQCRDPSSGQKSFATADIPTDVAIRSVTTELNLLHITLENGPPSQSHPTHIVTLPSSRISTLLQQKAPVSARVATRRRFGQVHWDAAAFTSTAAARKVDYEEYMQPDSTAFWDVVRDLARYGLVFLKNVPGDEDAISRITTRIAHIRETFYGRTFDVRAKPRAENVAYTSGYLGLHQDLLYLDPPPHIQILHCLENSCRGGESLFSDGDRVARMLWQLSNEGHPLASSLAAVKVPYAYDKNGHRYRRERTMLVDEDGDGERFGNYFWSPPFQGLFDRPEDLSQWIAGAKVFETAVNAPEAVYKTRMEPGDAALFDNLRVMHGRTAFDAEGGGSRWLRGAYIDGQDFFSTASHAPITHAVAADDEAGFWDERAHTDELASSGWHEDLLLRLERAGR
jgi:gamma-butyrobetaine dioxygenase